MKPEDFHLVIHDEAHYVNGENMARAAVDKFQGAIQLGVTATPEYSRNRTVANKLTHRYYNLPLNTAIEARRPVPRPPNADQNEVDGTGSDQPESCQGVSEQQHGKPLTEGQMEQLYNQARNRAIIKAYITGVHPDTEARYLGQAGHDFLRRHRPLR